MSKIAIIKVNLVPEASEATHNQIEKEITESLQADWLLRIEKVTVLDARCQ
jgi:ribosomal protein S27AE